MGGFQVMPFIKFFRCNVRHAVALVIYFSFYLLISLHFSFHLSTFREYSAHYYNIIMRKDTGARKKVYKDFLAGRAAGSVTPR